MRLYAIAPLLLAGVAAGCSNLPAKDAQCGNGVIDPGEDCDNSLTTCDDQCRLLCPLGYDVECDAASTDPEHSAYKCGADHVCHAPSGVFRHEVSNEFDYAVGQGHIADLDGDKIGDVAGFSDVNIDVRFGDAAAALTQRATAIVPFADTNVALRRIPGDPGDPTDPAKPQIPETSDILLPTADGIAGFTARNKSLVAYPFTGGPGARGGCAGNEKPTVVNGMPTTVTTAEPRDSFAIDKHHLAFVSRVTHDGAVLAGQAEGTLILSVMDPYNPTQCAHVPLCANSANPPKAPESAQKTHVFSDHYEVPKTAIGEIVSSVIAVASTDSAASPGAPACAARFTHDDTGFHLVATAQSFDVGQGPLALARATANEVCPALFAPRVPTQTDASSIAYYPPTASPPCLVQTTPTSTLGNSQQFPAGHVALVPAPPGSANQYDPDLLALVTITGFSGTTSLFSLANGAPGLKVYESPRPLYPIRGADIDGDGSIEAIGAVGASVQGGQPDIDVLYRTNLPSPPPGFVGFVPYRIPTLAAPTFFDLGDFDGNGILDIAYTERAATYSRLSISYGTRDRPLDPVEIATFTNVVALTLIDVNDALDVRGDVLDDLLVVDLVPAPTQDNPQAQTPLLAILHGNPQRSMLAYFDPRAEVQGTMEDYKGTALVSALTGEFVLDTPGQDLVSFERIPGNSIGGGLTDRMRIWTSRSSSFTQGFLDVKQTRIETTAIAIGACTANAALCLNRGAYLAPWTLPTGRDVVIAADSPRALEPHYFVTIDPLDTSTPVVSNTAASIPPGQFAVSMWSAAIDDSGSKLVVSVPFIREFSPLGLDGTPTVLVCDIDDRGRVTSCSDLATLVDELHGLECGAAEKGRVVPGSRFEGGVLGPQGFLALCSGAIYRVQLDAQRDRLVATKVVPAAGNYRFLSVGDLNGDYVDDVVGIGFNADGSPVVSLHLQCDSHDVTCIEANTGGPPVPGEAP